MDIEEDILLAAKELAKKEGRTAGQILSTLARKGLTQGSPKEFSIREGVPVFPSRGEVITLEKVQQIMDKEGV